MALRSNAKIELLKSVPLAGCSKAELRRLASIADEIDLRAGTVLTREGRIAHEFFVLIEGTVRVTKENRKVADLGPETGSARSRFSQERHGRRRSRRRHRCARWSSPIASSGSWSARCLPSR